MNLNLFNSMFPNYYNGLQGPMWSKWKYEDDKIILNVAVPGFEKEDFNLSIEDGDLILRIQSEKKNLIYSILDKFYSDSYELDKVKAVYKNGMLKITIPKTAKKTKKIEIEVS